MPQDLPKPAAAGAREAAVICLWPERLLFIGRLRKVTLHRHAAAVFLLALESELRVRIPPQRQWRKARSGLIPAGCTHELDLQGGLASVFYNDPHRPYYRRLSARDARQPSLAPAAEARLQISLLEYYQAQKAGASPDPSTVERHLARALKPYSQAPRFDQRIQQTLGLIQTDLSRNSPLAAMAAAVGLSPSRLQHLFLAETGVPLRRFRQRVRFRWMLGRIAAGDSLTTAALDAGFANSSHFSHSFKAMFGVSAASVLGSSTVLHFVNRMDLAQPPAE